MAEEIGGVLMALRRHSQEPEEDIREGGGRPKELRGAPGLCLHTQSLRLTADVWGSKVHSFIHSLYFHATFPHNHAQNGLQQRIRDVFQTNTTKTIS